MTSPARRSRTALAPSRASAPLRLALALSLVVLAGACGADGGGGGTDTSVADTGHDAQGDAPEDAGDDALDTGESDSDTADIGPTDHSKLCLPCESDAECGLGAICLGTAAGAWCATPCSERLRCPDGYACRTFDGEAGIAELCVPDEGFCENCPDVDNDGFAVGPDCGPIDCSPADPNAHPEADEVCNGRDDDCDGVADEGFDLSSDEANCGACGHACQPDNGVGECTRGSCRLVECDETHVDCNGLYADGCEAPVERENGCGGCAILVADPGDPCGACGSGVWACSGRDRVICSGDRGDAAVNACGGCNDLGVRVGAACGRCRRGLVVCDGTEDTECALPADAAEWSECGSICCGPTETCVDGACGEDVDCADDDDCDGDRWCDSASGACLSWGSGDADEFCQRDPVVASNVSPEIQCAFTRAPAGDPYPNHVHVLGTPMVADFDFDADDEVVRPSIVLVADDGDSGTTEAGSELPTGVVRVLDGRTCDLQYTITGTFVSHSSPPAVGDLDGDGRPEIVTFGGTGGVVAFRFDAAADRWNLYWTSHRSDGTPYRATGGGWGGPGIHDIDNDGVPEVLRGATVLSNTGVLIDDSLASLQIGAAPANMSFAADLDGDGRVEIAGGDRVWQWSTTNRRWEQEAYVTAVNLRGFVAMADFGTFPGPTPSLRAAPQLVVVSNGTVRVQTLPGLVVFGPIDLPPDDTGGPPTIADYDGDGRPEFAVAARALFTVFDLDCTASPTHECASRRTDGVLWSRPIQDFSSHQTGSTAFDFDGDGRAEAVFGDECFVRIYDGERGDVLLSQQRSSCTYHENPVVADVDGDFNAELVVGSNLNCDDPFVEGVGGVTCRGLDAGGVDPQFAGLRCDANADCVSGQCRSGFCRCTVTDQCCASGECSTAGWACVEPPVGTPGSGKTCRAAHTQPSTGIRVYADALDQWVPARRIWNQHAYAVTNVADDGTIPRTADVLPNWATPGLNNFRQNVPGDVDPLAAPDLTSSTRETSLYCDPAEGALHLDVDVCNRGLQPIDVGVPVAFRVGSPNPGVEEICVEYTETILHGGECETVTCRWLLPPTVRPGVDIWVVPDASLGVLECNEGNNTSVLRGVYCAD